MKHKRTTWLYCRIDPEMKRSMRKASDRRRLSFADYLIQIHLKDLAAHTAMAKPKRRPRKA